jgi:hydrogenase maturation protease
MARVLIVCYGNPLRSDDGIAWRAADALEGKFPKSEVEVLSLQQLAPEVADACRQLEAVLFIDAAFVDDIKNSRSGEIRVSEVSAVQNRERHDHFSHVYSPAKILGLARELYGATPRAFLITVAGENFEHGECLSAPVANALPELIARVEQLVEAGLSKPRTTKDAK